MLKIRVENWCGHKIRFIEHKGEWWAILKDICSALDLRTKDVSQRLHPDMLERVLVEFADDLTSVEPSSNRGRGERKSMWMLAVNELGIYEALFASRRLEARKFRMWAGNVLQRLRKNVGLAQYEVMRMTDSVIQDEIDRILDTLFYDESTGKLMRSVTVQGGDVEQVEFEY